MKINFPGVKVSFDILANLKRTHWLFCCISVNDLFTANVICGRASPFNMDKMSRGEKQLAKMEIENTSGYV